MPNRPRSPTVDILGVPVNHDLQQVLIATTVATRSLKPATAILLGPALIFGCFRFIRVIFSPIGAFAALCVLVCAIHDVFSSKENSWMSNDRCMLCSASDVPSAPKTASNTTPAPSFMKPADIAVIGSNAPAAGEQLRLTLLGSAYISKEERPIQVMCNVVTQLHVGHGTVGAMRVITMNPIEPEYMASLYKSTVAFDPGHPLKGEPVTGQERVADCIAYQQ